MDSPRHIIADGGSYDRPYRAYHPYWAAIMSSVFGEPYEVDGKTLIPVEQVRSFGMGWSSKNGSGGGALFFGSPASRKKRVAVIEVDQGQVRIVRIPDYLPIIIGGMLVGAWNLYWIL